MNGWHRSVETYLQEIAGEALVREKVHRASHYRYKRLLNWFQVPLIAISAVNGAVQLLSKNYPTLEDTLITATASTSVFVSILSAVSAFLKIGENTSTHAKCQSEWASLYNNIRCQLMLSPDLRTEGSEFLQQVKADFKQLVEFSPLPSASAIARVKRDIATSKHPDFCVPATLNGFSSIRVYSRDDSYQSNTDTNELLNV